MQLGCCEQAQQGGSYIFATATRGLWHTRCVAQSRRPRSLEGRGGIPSFACACKTAALRIAAAPSLQETPRRMDTTQPTTRDQVSPHKVNRASGPASTKRTNEKTCNQANKNAKQDVNKSATLTKADDGIMKLVIKERLMADLQSAGVHADLPLADQYEPTEQSQTATQHYAEATRSWTHPEKPLVLNDDNIVQSKFTDASMNYVRPKHRLEAVDRQMQTANHRIGINERQTTGAADCPPLCGSAEAHKLAQMK